MITYDGIRADAAEEEEEEEQLLLDEIDEFMAEHLVVTDAQRTAMILYAAATHALDAFPAFGRMLWVGQEENSGKTTGMLITAALSANPVNAKGTMYGLRSALAAASNEPERPMPAFYYDEISNVYGTSGLNRGGLTTLTLLIQEGYKKGATDSWSVNRTEHKFSVYAPFLMTGLRTAVPRDIRSRCIVISMRKAVPEKYFDVRESEPWAAKLAEALDYAVKERFADLAAFRARGLHPKLEDRRLEVWEPLFAVASALGGQKWLSRCMTAFMELALDTSDQIRLSPKQEIIRDAAQLTQAVFTGQPFIGGMALADEMRRMDNPLYSARSPLGMARLIGDALQVASHQVRIGKERLMGYLSADITAAWDAIRPQDPDIIKMPEEENPFDVRDGRDEDLDALLGNKPLASSVRGGKDKRSAA